MGKKSDNNNFRTWVEIWNTVKSLTGDVDVYGKGTIQTQLDRYGINLATLENVIGTTDISGFADGTLTGIVENLAAVDVELNKQINLAINIANGVNRARVFDTTTSMLEWLKNPSNRGVANVGDNLYMVELNVPDYWISEVLNEPNEHGYYYEIAPLEGPKVDLTTYDEKIEKIRSHVGMIVQSTTLDTMDKVIDIYGGTNWVLIKGRFLIGASDNYAVGTTGGSVNHSHGVPNTNNTVLTLNQIPSHNHSIPSLTGNSSSNGNHTHYKNGLSGVTDQKGKHTHTVRGFSNTDDFNFTGTGDYFAAADAGYDPYNQIITESGEHSHTVSIGSFTVDNAGEHSHTVSTDPNTTGNCGAGSGHNHSIPETKSSSNIPPYKVVYIWERTK